tara:strand:- start:359 stop:613 length:255 start_codon:yes stop_codon:yes gene_type:complete
MKELNMSWSDIKATPMIELQGLLKAFDNYTVYHAFDGYNSKDIETMAKDKPEVRKNYAKSQGMKNKYDMLLGKRKTIKSFRELL